MTHDIIKSYAKINLALNIISKNSKLHKIESIVGFISLHDVITIKKVQSRKHIISFDGKLHPLQSGLYFSSYIHTI